MALKESQHQHGSYLPALILLCASALMLVAGSVYLIQIFSVLYGAGLGIGTIAQGLPANYSVSEGIETFLSQTSSLHNSALESYVLLIVSILMFGIAFLMFLRYYDTGKSGTAKKYALPYLGFIVVYLLLFYTEISPFTSYFQSAYMYVIYAGMMLSVLSGGYTEYLNRRPSPGRSGEHMKSAINIDPSKPFSNLVDLQNELFAKMSGQLRIVDKHFNSAALSNFHRLADRSIKNFTKITILSSKEMLDTDFSTNLNDFRNELHEAGVSLEVRLLDDKDAQEQHERLLMDDKFAYSVPPFNIITKKSEHITRISINEAQKRFVQLYGRAIKLENYNVKRARGEQPQEPPRQPQPGPQGQGRP